MLFKNKTKLKYILGITAAVVLMVVLTILLTPAVTELVSDPKHFEGFIHSYGNLSILVFLGFQILQVVIAAIPGEFIQIAGGYIFGSIMGTVYSVMGILIGAVIAFFAARFLGVKLVSKLLSEKSVEKFNFLLNTRKSEIIIFVLFLIPGLPKDILVYIAGLSPIKPLRFFSIYTVARLPGLVGSSIIGANIQSQNYLVAIIVFIVSCLLFFGGLLARELILNKLKSHSHQDEA
ncbi:MAG: TVP38/TMEM64 family protein [Clostridia bacterium]|nr:TVP38/TMEM64 family protein [Clostridia bacterium]